ncbi:hypothetical protein O988_01240 [Pseudogymnoascus sp. VKM F-3808]|nr:hypothetical protein O988_01240 [Pseudogymnoascus sp. VKM F-3808]
MPPFRTFLNYQVEHSSSSNPNTKSTTHRVASGPPTLIQTAQGTSADDSEPQQPMDTQQHDRPVDMLTTMHLCSMSPPTLQWLALSVQPPALTRPRVELFPPPVARLLKTNIEVREVYAIATLHSKNGLERQEQIVRLCSNRIFCFSGIKAPEEGVYTFRVTLVYGCYVVEYMDSNAIHSIPRPTENVIPVQDTQKLKRQLLYMNEIIYTDGYIGFFPNRKIYAGSMIYLGQQKYMKVMVLIPGSELIVGNNNVDGFYNARDGLAVHEDGNWYDNGEVEWADGSDKTIYLGGDGEMYRKRISGIFSSFFVGLERKVTVVENVLYVTYDFSHTPLNNIRPQPFDNRSPMQTQLPHLQIDLEDIAILNKIGSGNAGVVFEATIASLNNGENVALKVFKPYLWQYHYTFSTVTGRPLSPFDRELAALSAIQRDEESKIDLPVVEAYGWFELPANFQHGRFKLSEDSTAKVLVKRLVHSPPFDFAKVTPSDMIRHRDTLDRLRIYDTDIRPENFLAV